MRRLFIASLVLVGLVGLTGGGALAQAPTPAPAAPGAGADAKPGKKVCTIDDPRLVELSGLAAVDDGYVVVNDSSDLDERKRVFYLDEDCDVADAIRFGSEPRDPEDLALSPDRRTLWIADTGDLEGERETVALWRMPADGSEQPELFRMRYPDGAKDAEALLVGADGLPVLVTKGAQALVYKPATEPGRGTTELRKVGEVTLPRTDTTNPLGPAGRLAVTGGAVAPDGARATLRTYADAFEWDVADGDVAAAITAGTPRVTPLPDEPWGESISYSLDGQTFLTVSETAQQEGLKPVILRYTPAVAAAADGAGDGDGDAAGATGKDSRSLLEKVDLNDVTMLVGGVGVFGVLLVGIGMGGIVRSRRRRRSPLLDDDDHVGPPDDRDPVPVPVGARAESDEFTEVLARVSDEPRYGQPGSDTGSPGSGGGTGGSPGSGGAGGSAAVAAAPVGSGSGQPSTGTGAARSNASRSNASRTGAAGGVEADRGAARSGSVYGKPPAGVQPGGPDDDPDEPRTGTTYGSVRSGDGPEPGDARPAGRGATPGTAARGATPGTAGTAGGEGTSDTTGLSGSGGTSGTASLSTSIGAIYGSPPPLPAPPPHRLPVGEAVYGGNRMGTDLNGFPPAFGMPDASGQYRSGEIFGPTGPPSVTGDGFPATPYPPADGAPRGVYQSGGGLPAAGLADPTAPPAPATTSPTAEQPGRGDGGYPPATRA